MKTLKEYIYEGLLRGQQSTLDSGEEAVYVLIEEFLKENYNGTWTISEKPNKDGLYEVSSNESVKVTNMKITSLTNDLFIWTSVKGNFSCSGCEKLESLEGAPKEQGHNFSCYDCKSLTTLKGAPKEVGGNFNCSGCKELKTLEGAPEIVEGFFDCFNCRSLKSLEGAPKEAGNFDCTDCGKKFTKDDVQKVSKVNGNIYC